MRKQVENIIESYNSIELAFFAKYRLKTYMPETQTKIINLLKKRNLSKEKIDKIVKEVEFNTKIKLTKDQCPRCFSKRLFTREEEIFKNSRSSAIDPTSYRTDIEKRKMFICQICGFNLSDDNGPSLLSRLIKRIKEKIL